MMHIYVFCSLFVDGVHTVFFLNFFFTISSYPVGLVPTSKAAFPRCSVDVCDIRRQWFSMRRCVRLRVPTVYLHSGAFFSSSSRSINERLITYSSAEYLHAMITVLSQCNRSTSCKFFDGCRVTVPFNQYVDFNNDRIRLHLNYHRIKLIILYTNIYFSTKILLIS